MPSASTTPTHASDAAVDTPATQPESADTPAPALSLSALKARRAQDRATQRARKAGDRAKGKHAKGRALAEPAAAASAGVKVALWDAWAEAKAADEWPRPSEPVRVLAGTWAREREQQRVQVRLADLVRPSTRKGVEHDFEVIPHVRSVIVLDDGAPEDELDEPWEYLSSEGEEDRRAPSYAEILAAPRAK